MSVWSLTHMNIMNMLPFPPLSMLGFLCLGERHWRSFQTYFYMFLSSVSAETWTSPWTTLCSAHHSFNAFSKMVVNLVLVRNITEVFIHPFKATLIEKDRDTIGNDDKKWFIFYIFIKCDKSTQGVKTRKHNAKGPKTCYMNVDHQKLQRCLRQRDIKQTCQRRRVFCSTSMLEPLYSQHWSGFRVWATGVWPLLLASQITVHAFLHRSAGGSRCCSSCSGHLSPGPPDYLTPPQTRRCPPPSSQASSPRGSPRWPYTAV